MRENRTHGSEGGEGESSSLPLSKTPCALLVFCRSPVLLGDCGFGIFTAHRAEDLRSYRNTLCGAGFCRSPVSLGDCGFGAGVIRWEEPRASKISRSVEAGEPGHAAFRYVTIAVGDHRPYRRGITSLGIAETRSKQELDSL